MNITRIHEYMLAFIILVFFVWVTVEQGEWARDFLTTLEGQHMSTLCELHGGCGDR
jgi:hypothetical protein